MSVFWLFSRKSERSQDLEKTGVIAAAPALVLSPFPCLSRHACTSHYTSASGVDTLYKRMTVPAEITACQQAPLFHSSTLVSIARAGHGHLCLSKQGPLVRQQRQDAWMLRVFLPFLIARYLSCCLPSNCALQTDSFLLLLF